ncbi:SDR family oxidoreductase [Pokkaliibacter sp. CJK22405]|uniref:SDR family oxidoreductase n=1 Tax=Pokkaliibacter sp. CJK22405 TaxID=3384615 RepID=UPI0039849629
MKIMLVTGAGRGIGAATARLAARQGYGVIINYRVNHAAAEALCQEIRHGGGEAWVCQADVGLENEVENLFAEVDRRGTLTVLVNNAGRLGMQCRLDEITLERWQMVLNTNATSTFLCCREAVQRMAYRHGGQGGTIVNVSSGAAKSGAPNEYVDYAAAKGAVESLTLGLAREVAHEGIRVNGVRPGFILTDIHAEGGEPDRVQRLAPSIPMQRGGTAHEVAEAILWLASDKSSYTTGSFIDVLGGR